MRGFTLIELTIVIAIIMILAVAAVGPAHQHMMMAHETAALQQIKTIQVAETAYYGSFGKYAASLAALGPSGYGMIPKGLADGRKSGYLYAATPTKGGYDLSVVPETLGSTGRRSFYADETLVIRSSWTSEAESAASPAIE